MATREQNARRRKTRNPSPGKTGAPKRQHGWVDLDPQQPQPVVTPAHPEPAGAAAGASTPAATRKRRLRPKRSKGTPPAPQLFTEAEAQRMKDALGL